MKKRIAINIMLAFIICALINLVRSLARVFCRQVGHPRFRNGSRIVSGTVVGCDPTGTNNGTSGLVAREHLCQESTIGDVNDALEYLGLRDKK